MATESNGPAESLSHPGHTLRQAREAKELSLAMAARQLNLPERTLDRLENGDFGALPGHTFTRGYIRSYAKLLGLDPERLVVEFDRFTGTDATGSHVHTLSRIEEPVRLASIGLRLISFLVLLGLAGVAFYLWQDRANLAELGQMTGTLGRIEVDGADGTTQVHSFDEPEDLAVLDNQPDEPLDTPVPGEGEAVADATEPALSADATLATQVPVPVESAPAPASPAVEAAPTAAPSPAAPSTPAGVASEPTAPAPAAAQSVAAPAMAGAASLELRFDAECWTRVTDADGKVLLNTLMPAGSTRTVQGKAPLSVVLGYSRGVDVIFNGEPVDIAPYRRGETARFQLGQ